MNLTRLPDPPDPNSFNVSNPGAWVTAVTNWMQATKSAIEGDSTTNIALLAMVANTGLQLQGGIVTAPSMSFADDPTTGIYQPTIGQIAIATEGMQRLLIDGSGNITVFGTLAVTGTVSGAGAFTTLSASSTVSGAGFVALHAAPGPIGSTTASTGAFTTLSASSTVSGAGVVALLAAPGPIGSTTASTGAFTTVTATGTITGGVGGSSGQSQLSQGDATHTGYLALYNAAAVRQGYVGYATAGGYINLANDAGTIGYATSAALSVGTSLNVGTSINTGTTLNVGTTLSVQGGLGASNTGPYIVNAGGTFTATAWTWSISASFANGLEATGFLTYSDRRKKSDIEDITPEEGVDWIKRGRPRKFILDGAPRTGFIAQEDVAARRHDAVTTIKDDDPTYAESDGVAPPGHRLARDYTHDIAYLTAALQSALQRIEALEKR